MSRLRFVPIVVGALALHSAGAVAQQAPALRTLASFRGSGWFPNVGTSPNGRFVLLATATNLRMYDVASRQSWNLAEGGAGLLRWSPRGDMIAFVRAGDGGSGDHVWAMPVDANTGRARGPAQRVTIGQVGNWMSFSVDGQWIAFAGVDSGQARSLSIVPATGGPERVLARFPNGLGAFEWSADGRTIYAHAPAPGTNGWSILKIRVDGGAQEVIRSRDEYLVGMTADRRHLVLLPRKNPITAGEQGTVIDTTGREVGHFPLPVAHVLFDCVLGDSAVVWVTHTDHRRLEVRPVAGGSARRLPRIGQSDDVPLWSPDGNRIALQVRDGNRTSLAVVNADGTNPREFRETDVVAYAWNGGIWWSPDSRSVGFLSPDRHRLSLLDVVAGTSRTILEDTTSVFVAWRWRADGQAIHLASRRSPGFPPGKSIDEVGVNGQLRRLLDLPIRTDLYHGFQFGGDAYVFVRSDSAALLMPLGAGPVRRLAGVPSGTQLYNTVVSSDLRWIAGLLGDARGTAWHQVELFSTETGARTVLDLPFEAGIYRPEFLPSDSSLLVFGNRSGETDTRIYRVPLNGDAPRAFADVGDVLWFGAASAASASPDGRSVVYSIEAEAPTTSLVLVDLRGAVPRTTSRSPRR